MENTQKQESQTKKEIQEYYGDILKNSQDLQTNACTLFDGPPDYIKKIISSIHPEVLERFYGCGLTVPQELENCSVLDLGSGSGRDCYIISKLVGENGKVVGVDMTDNQLAVAKKHIKYHQDTFGYKSSNVEFLKAELESLNKLNLEKESFDIAVSNCVINLCTDKEAVLKNIYNLLKEGGEMYFSDIYSDRRIKKELREDKLLYGECLSGALYWNDFINMAKKCGFHDPRLVESASITINNKEIENKVGDIKFYSATYRLFKIKDLEPACENYGQTVTYKGTIKHHPDKFILDEHHIIETNKSFPLCGNSYNMLNKSRFRKHFNFAGNIETHYGIFPECGTNMPFSNEGSKSSSCC